MEVLDIDVGIFGVDQPGESGAGLVERDIGDLGESGFQFAKTFHGGLRPRELLLVENDIAIVVGYRDERLVETPFLDSLGSALLAAVSDLVQFFAAEAFHGSDGIAANTLMALRMCPHETFVIAAHHRRLEASGHLVLRHLCREAHHLGAARNDAVFHPAHHLCRSERHTGDPAAAKPVERGAGGRHVISGVERCHAAQIARLHAILRADRPDHVIDRGGVEIVAILDGFEAGGCKVLRMHVRQRSLALFTDPARGPDGIDDVGFSHGVNSSPLFDSCGECRLTFA